MLAQQEIVVEEVLIQLLQQAFIPGFESGNGFFSYAQARHSATKPPPVRGTMNRL